MGGKGCVLNLIVVDILQCVHVSRDHAVHYQLTMVHINHISDLGSGGSKFQK